MTKSQKHRFVSLLSYVVFFSLLHKELVSLPKEPVVIAGDAEFVETLHAMEIKTKDQTILQFSSFDISQMERVTFTQPSKDSHVLSKVKGSNRSEILGKLESNGKLFLVNPNGIYFGPNAEVNIGSFIASTLDISSEDFLEKRYRFFQDGSDQVSIINDGTLVSPEGSIVLLAPQIENRGKIIAKAGQIFLGSAKQIVLDFTGDGLIQFALEKESEQLVLDFVHENGFYLEPSLGKKVIQDTLNIEGIEEGDFFIEKEGSIHLVSASYLTAEKVAVFSSEIKAEGVIQARDREKGGTIHLIGDNIFVQEAFLDANGADGGGEVFVGGDFQREGSLPLASRVSLDFMSEIQASALEKGDGGVVVLWSNDKTLFNGKILAKGGPLGGKGGEVETSSENRLEMHTGYVDTFSFSGEHGHWLLDPSILTISSSATTCDAAISQTPVYGSCCTSSECPNCNISTSVINASTVSASPSNVILQASELISVQSPISMQNPGVGLTFTGCSGTATLQLLANITTQSGAVIVSQGMNVQLSESVTIDTTNGGNSSGGDISFLSLVDATVEGNQNLTLTAGVGSVFFTEAIGSQVRLGTLTITSAKDVVTSNVFASAILQMAGSGLTTFGGSITTRAFGGVNLTGHNFIFQDQVFADSNGSVEITNTGTLLIERPASMRMGGVFFQNGGGRSFIGSDITVLGDVASLIFTDPVFVTHDILLTTTNGDIGFGKIEGPGAISIEAGSGELLLLGNIGELNPLGGLIVSSSAVSIERSFIRTSGSQSYTGPVVVNDNVAFSSLSGDITFGSSLESGQSGSNFLFSLGGGALTLDTLGLSSPAGEVAVFGSGQFIENGIIATSLEIGGGQSAVQLQGAIQLSGSLGLIIDGKSISIGAPIEANRVFFRAIDSILNTGGPVSVTAVGERLIAFDYFNSLNGSVGLAENPIEINTSKEVFVGSSYRADFIGSSETLRVGYVPDNVPCIVTYNGSVLRNCTLFQNVNENLFEALPKNLFYIPGIYSSWGWDNLSSDFYFKQWASYPTENERERSLFWLNSKEKSIVEKKYPFIEKPQLSKKKDRPKVILR